jgi:hypothetical protein
MRTKVLILCIFLMSAFGYFNSSYTLAANNVDFFKEIVEAAEGRVVEFGVKASFDVSEEKEAYCLELLKKLELNGADISVIKDDKFYCIEFSNSKIKGYIESTSYDNYNVVTLNIVQYDTQYRMPELKYRVSNAIGKDEKEVRYFDYLKAQISGGDKIRINRKIAGMLRKYNSSNIDTVEIDNGYSTVAYTKKYPVMMNNGKMMDLNYAVCSYSSGDYIIIGTPVIIPTY